MLPVGISFFTFQAMSYVIDVHQEKIKAERSLLKFSTYISLFPQLVAGPIVRAKSLIRFLGNKSQLKSLIRKNGGIYKLKYNNYHLHLFFIEYDENLPKYFNQNQSP